MIKQYFSIFRRAIIVLDCFLIAAAFFTAYYIRKYIVNGMFLYDVYFIKTYIWILFVVMGIWIVALYVMGMYQSFRLKRGQELVATIIKSGFLTFFLFAAASYVFKFEHISRSFVGIFFGMTALFLLLEKIAMLFLFRSLRSGGFNFRNLMVVGTGQRAEKFLEYLEEHKELGLKVVALIDEDKERVGHTVRGHEVIGTLDDIPTILRDRVVDYAIFIVPRKSLHKIEGALIQCEVVGVTASVAMDLFNLRATQGKETSMMDVPMVTFERTPHSFSALFIKRIIDISVSYAALVVISPIYLLIALAIKITSPGPVYFTQERVGLNGRTFKLYKFRTMQTDAEEKLKELMAFNEMQGPAFKMENDPRVTGIGKILRKLSLDELPQLWNVLHGDMSLVGPRPPLPKEVKEYDPWHQRRLSMRPGITCIWQVSGRNRISDFDRWVKMDLDYIDNWSLGLDMKILIKTIPAVLSTSGAK